MKTILVTGCSSGFGVDIARRFLEWEWSVIATMRTPKDDVLPRSERLKVLPLDVTKAESIRQVIDAAGPIDALVNNAGIGWLNALEGTSVEMMRDLFETNAIGAIAMTQAVLPQFRARKSGVVVQVSSSVTLRPLPLLSVYTATKAALNAFTESVALELEPFDVRVRIVLPGRAPDTRFGENARAKMNGFPEPYMPIAQKVMARFQSTEPTPITRSEQVADAVWRAVTDPSAPMRIPAGDDAVALAGE